MRGYGSDYSWVQPGPAPRVTVDLSLSDPSSISLFLSNHWQLIFGGAATLLILSSMGGRRRR